MTTAGALLAAGAGSRFVGDNHKLLSRIGGKTVLEHALDTMLEAGFDQAIVVQGAVDLRRTIGPRNVLIAENPDWARGIAWSLTVACGWAEQGHHDAVVIGLADQPGITPDAWRSVAASDATPIALATYDGRRGNPVRLAAEAWPLLPTDGDEGARVLMRDRPELVTEVPCSGTAFDIDTVQDLHQLGDELSRWTSSTTDHGGTP